MKIKGWKKSKKFKDVWLSNNGNFEVSVIFVDTGYMVSYIDYIKNKRTFSKKTYSYFKSAYDEAVKFMRKNP